MNGTVKLVFLLRFETAHVDRTLLSGACVSVRSC